MQYRHIREGRFLARPNRFIAMVAVDGKVVRTHVKNTGRCAELLLPGVRVWLEYSENPQRNTPCDLVVVEKRLSRQQPGSVMAPALEELLLTDENGAEYCAPAQLAGYARIINMDSAAPNTVAGEWLTAGGLGQLQDIAAEKTVGDSRFDFTAVSPEGTPMAIEVKGCTLEQEGLGEFPDAPTLRGVKHLQGLTALVKQGWQCTLIIVVQMQGIHTFAPNWKTHPQFGYALQQAVQAGVQLRVLGCMVTPESLTVAGNIPARLAPNE